MESALVHVVQPWSTRHGQYGLIALYEDLEKFDGTRAQIACSCVEQLAGDTVQDCTQQNAILFVRSIQSRVKNIESK